MFDFCFSISNFLSSHLKSSNLLSDFISLNTPFQAFKAESVNDFWVLALRYIAVE